MIILHDQIGFIRDAGIAQFMKIDKCNPPQKQRKKYIITSLDAEKAFS